jgi:hypothetical protein
VGPDSGEGEEAGAESLRWLLMNAVMSAKFEADMEVRGEVPPTKFTLLKVMDALKTEMQRMPVPVQSMVDGAPCIDRADVLLMAGNVELMVVLQLEAEAYSAWVRTMLPVVPLAKMQPTTEVHGSAAEGRACMASHSSQQRRK